MLDLLERYLVVGLHIPDGFLTVPVSLLFWLITVVCVGLAVQRTNAALDDRQVPLMGVMAACIFAAQMLNFPVAGGTSGHLLGGALAAITLGPWAAVLVMACVVGLQALLFQDGGLVVMGANIFNMGIITALIGSAIFFGLLRMVGRRPWGLVVSGFVAGWLSVLLASTLTSLQLIFSGTAPAQVVLTAMTGVHLLIGIGEGLITGAALSFLLATRPDLLPATIADDIAGRRRPISKTSVLGVGLAVAALLALLSPLASGSPDGLERVAENLGFLDRGQDASYNVIPDYMVPGFEGGFSTILAGLVGVLILAALGYGLATVLRRRQSASSTTDAGSNPGRAG